MPRRVPLDESLLYLVRTDSDRSKGWQLRIPSWHPDGPVTIYFADAAYGGSEGALEAGRTRRHAVFTARGIQMVRHHHETNTRNVSGIVGIAPLYDPRARDPNALRGWTAYYSEDGRQIKKRFSFASYGSGALSRAIEWREANAKVQFTSIQLVAIYDLQSEILNSFKPVLKLRQKALSQLSLSQQSNSKRKAVDANASTAE